MYGCWFLVTDKCLPYHEVRVCIGCHPVCCCHSLTHLCLQVLINGATLGVSLVVALFTPGGAEKVYSIVGATGAAALAVSAPSERLTGCVFIATWVA